jgi:hypothetical protein
MGVRIPQTAGQNEFGKILFAHTSPIYVAVEGQRLFRGDVARGLLSEMKSSQDFINEKGAFGNDEEREAVLRVYRDAIVAFQRQTEAHSAAANGSR